MLSNNLFGVWQTAVNGALTNFIQASLAFLPKLIASFLLFVFGVIISNWLKSLTVKSFHWLKLDLFTKDKKVKKFLKEAEIGHKIEEVIGSLVKWIAILIFFIASLNILGLTTISTLLFGLVAYLPNVISAIVVLALGVLLAGFMESLVKGALASIDLKTSRLMGKITSYVVVVIAFLVAISELNIAQSFINILFIGFVATLSLGLGLAIGLGGKDLVSQILNDWYRDLKQDLGSGHQTKN